MKCPGCGAENPVFVNDCLRCRKPLRTSSSAKLAQHAPSAPATRSTEGAAAGAGSTVVTPPRSPKRNTLHWLMDGIAAVSLLLAVGLTVSYDLRRDAIRPESAGGGTGVVLRDNATDTKSVPGARRIAVTPAQFDDIGDLLETLGEGYRFSALPLDALADVARLKDFDVIFVTCGTAPADWQGEYVRQGDMTGTETREWKSDVAERVRHSLRQFVAGGGTLYASDWRFTMVATAFSEFVDQAAMAPGDEQELAAEIVDAGLRDLVQSPLPLRFDLAGWYPAAFQGPSVTTFVRGRYRTAQGNYAVAPLLVRFPFQSGNVVFTSFHNEKQHSAKEIELLRYLVFSTLTARVQSQVATTMLQGGFSPQKQSILSASPGTPTVSRVYHCTESSRLQFALAFEDQGALLRLTVTGPSGEFFTREGGSTFSLDVANAAVGDWTYRIEAARLPSPNFPFALTIGQKPAQ